MSQAIFPTSYYITGNGQGGSLPFDALDVMIAAAKKYGLQIHAWINPYRVKAAGSKFSLSSDNQAYIWMNNPSTSHYVMEYGGGYYYNPAIPEVRQLVINGVKELVQNYDLDGIHFDDYFYPGYRRFAGRKQLSGIYLFGRHLEPGRVEKGKCQYAGTRHLCCGKSD